PPISTLLPYTTLFRSPSTTAPAVEQARRLVPTPSPWTASLSATPETVSIRIAAPDLAAERITEAWFFPMHWGVIDHAPVHGEERSEEHTSELPSLTNL